VSAIQLNGLLAGQAGSRRSRCSSQASSSCFQWSRTRSFRISPRSIVTVRAPSMGGCLIVRFSVGQSPLTSLLVAVSKKIFIRVFSCPAGSDRSKHEYQSPNTRMACSPVFLVAIRYRKKRTAGGGMSRSPDAHRRDVRASTPSRRAAAICDSPRVSIVSRNSSGVIARMRGTCAGL